MGLPMTEAPIWKGWTDEAHAILVEETANGLSASQIGRILGCSRNACIGRRHRQGIASTIPAWSPTQGSAPPAAYRATRAENAKMQSVIRRTFKSGAGRPPKPTKPILSVVQEWPGKILADLDAGECRKPREDSRPPIGEADETIYCAKPIPTDERYCPACRAVMFKAVPTRAQQASAARARAAKAFKPRAA